MANYPEWRKQLDRLKEKFFPVNAERELIKLMSWHRLPLWWWLGHWEHQGRLGPYRPDFISHRKKQIIEVENRQKYQSGNIVHDQEYKEAQERKWNWYTRRGYNLHVIWNHEIYGDPRLVRKSLKRWSRNPRKYSI